MSDVIEVPAAHKNLINSNITVANASIIGVGHLGSDLAYNIAKLGVPELYLYDSDQVERRNLSGTVYTRSHIGSDKVLALKEIIIESNFEPKYIQVFAKNVECAGDIKQNTQFFIIATDSLESRISIFEAISEQLLPDEQAYLIDIRSRSTVAEVYGFPLEDETARYWFSENLKSKRKDPTKPVHCNESNIIQNTKLITSIATQIFSDVLDGDRKPKYFRSNIRDYKVFPVKLNWDEIIKNYENYILSQPCPNCSKNHRSMNAREKCIKKSKNSEADGDRLPDRSELFDF